MNPKRGALTPAQAVAWVLALLVIGAIGYGVYLAAARAWHRRGVRAAVPAYLDGLRAQRDRLGRAVEKYHAHFGFYPPNHSTNASRAELNPLYYELVGARWLARYGTFGLPTTKEPVQPEEMLKAFNTTSFSNTLPFPAWPTNFIEGLPFFGRKQGEVILASSSTPEGINEKFSDDFITTPWRYAADPAEHNPGQFDLWLELTVLDQHFIIGNWEAVR